MHAAMRVTQQRVDKHDVRHKAFYQVSESVLEYSRASLKLY